MKQQISLSAFLKLHFGVNSLPSTGRRFAPNAREMKQLADDVERLQTTATAGNGLSELAKKRLPDAVRKLADARIRQIMFCPNLRDCSCQKDAARRAQSDARRAMKAIPPSPFFTCTEPAKAAA